MPQFFKSVLASLVGTFLALALVFFGFFMVVLSSVTFFSGVKVAAVTEPSLLFIALEGQLVEKDDPFQFNFREQIFFGGKARSHGLFDLQEALSLAANNDKIKGVFFHLNGLSSGYSKVESLRKSIEAFKASGKPVIGYADSLNGTEAYLATAFDRLEVNKFVTADIRGISFIFSFFKGTLDKLGIETLTFREGEYKSAIETFTRSSVSEKARENFNEVGSHLWQQISKVHAERWGLTPAELNQKVNNLAFMAPGALLEYENVSVSGSVAATRDRLRDELIPNSSKKNGFVPYQRFLLGAMQSYGVLSTDAVAVVLAEGEIVDRGASAGSLIIGNKWASELRAVCNNKSVKAVVLRIDSPGGSAQAADIMDDEVKACAKSKPVFASFSDTAASGGYYMAAHAAKIYAEPTTVTGSIGVFALLFQMKDFLGGKLGLNFDSVKTHAYADLGNPGRPLAPLEAQRIQGMVSHVYDVFLNNVQEGRKFEDLEKLKSLAGGKIWTGFGAHEVGLVDELGGLQEAIRDVASEAQLDKYIVEFYPKAGNPFELVLKEMGLEMLTKLRLIKAYDLMNEVQESGPVQKLYMRLPWDLHFQRL